jgi:hypothetical protein
MRLHGVVKAYGNFTFIRGPIYSSPDRLWGPPSLISNGYRGGAHSPGVKRQGSEADHSRPSSAEVKNGGAIPSLLHISSWQGGR